MFDEDLYFIKLDGEKRSLNDIITENIERIIKARYNELTQVSDFNPGSEAYHAVLQQSMIQYDIEERQDQIDRNNMPFYMKGEYLDNFGTSLGVLRKSSRSSEGIVTFSRQNTDDKNVYNIRENQEISTSDGIIFITRDEETLEENDESVSVNVICQIPGSEGNVKKNTLNTILEDNDEYAGLSEYLSVNNPHDFIGGYDEEEDDNYRFRITTSVNNYAVGTKLWYENIVKKIDGINDVKYDNSDENLPGEVEIIFKPKNREKMSEIESQIHQLLEKDEYKILGIRVITKSVKFKKLDLEILYNTDIDSTLVLNYETINEAIIEKITKLINGLKINQNITAKKIEDEIRLIEEITEVNVIIKNPNLGKYESFYIEYEELKKNIKH